MNISYRLGEEGSCDRPNDGTILRGRRIIYIYVYIYLYCYVYIYT